MTVDSKIQWKNALGKETGLLETDTIPGYVYKCRFGLTAVKLGAQMCLVLNKVLFVESGMSFMRESKEENRKMMAGACQSSFDTVLWSECC